MKPVIEHIDISRDELRELLERARTALAEEDYRKLKAAVDALSYLTDLVADKDTTIRDLRQLLLPPSTEKTREILKKLGIALIVLLLILLAWLAFWSWRRRTSGWRRRGSRGATALPGRVRPGSPRCRTSWGRRSRTPGCGRSTGWNPEAPRETARCCGWRTGGPGRWPARRRGADATSSWLRP